MAAITCAEQQPRAAVTILEASREFLAKVRISGGGRCNVTHACFDAREFATRYPRGERELIGPLQRYGARETIAWFAERGVMLKTEPDGRMFPTTDTSATIVDCLVNAARGAGVRLITGARVENVTRTENGFALTVTSKPTLNCDRLLIATGGCRDGKLLAGLGHQILPPVPSLFTFNTDAFRDLPGVAVEVEATVPGTKLRERGPLLITHTGLSGPVILRLSAWGARVLHGMDYRFPLHINWLPGRDVAAELERNRRENGAKLITSAPLAPLPARLWAVLAGGANIRWSQLARADQQRLMQRLTRTEVQVTGKSTNKEEFVTCGGVVLREVDFKTMQSRRCPNLFLAGEVLDIDGITGGFNFQAAWATGFLAGQAMAQSF